MKIKNILSIILGLGLILFSCESTRLVSAEKLSKKSNKGYKTFAFAELLKKVKINRVDAEQKKTFFKAVIIQKMATRGYKLVKENPELLVNLDLNYIRLHTKSPMSGYNPSKGYSRYFYYNQYFNLEQERFAMEDQIIASIDLLFVDASEENKLWRGIVETKLSGNLDYRIQNLEIAIDMLLTGFEEGKDI